MGLHILLYVHKIEIFVLLFPIKFLKNVSTTVSEVGCILCIS